MLTLTGQTEPKDPQSTCTFNTPADKCLGFYSLNYCNLLTSLILYSLSLFKCPQQIELTTEHSHFHCHFISKACAKDATVCAHTLE